MRINFLRGTTAPQTESYPTRQYSIYVSPQVRAVLDQSLTRIIVGRLQNPYLAAPEKQFDSLEEYEQSVIERQIFRYARGEYFHYLETLLRINALIWQESAYVTGTLIELHELSSLVEHERDYLNLCPDNFNRMLRQNRGFVASETIGTWFDEVIEAVDLCEQHPAPTEVARQRFSLTLTIREWLYRKGLRV